MKKVILLGDSIRLSYQDEAARRLGGQYRVWKPEENCRFARYTLFSLSLWPKKELEGADVIHWNNGLWDVSVRYPEDGCFTPLEEYLADLKKIHRELKKTGAKIIFAATTPVRPGNPNRSNGDIALYNRRAAALLEPEGVVINDLFSLVYPHTGRYITDDMVHLTPDGREACGKAVAGIIAATACS